jgi:hypothetical protein
MKLYCSIVLTSEGIVPGKWHPCQSDPSDIDRAAREIAGLSVDSGEFSPEDSEYDRDLWKPTEDDRCMYVHVSGIVPFTLGMRFLEKIGAYYENCETMGTLGGPLGGWVPDFPFNVESQLQAVSIRITPILMNPAGEILPVREHSWRRLKELFQRWDAFDLSHMGVEA